MSHALLPADRVKAAAEKALLEFDPKMHGMDEALGERKRSWFNAIIGLCRGVLADRKAHHVIAVEANDFTWLMKQYDFTDPAIAAEEAYVAKMKHPTRN